MKIALKSKPAPAKKSVAKKSVAAKPKPRRSDDDDDIDTSDHKPTGPRKGVAAAGWGGADSIGGSSDFVKSLDFKNDAAKTGGTLWFILKFLEDAPYASVKIHWTDRTKGKRSFVCIGDDCPLCDIGADVKSEYRFNVAVFTEEEPMLKSWQAGWKIYKKIKSLSESALTSPLPKRTYLATRTGVKFNEITYDLDKISNDDIAEAYPNIYVPSAAEIAELEPYTLDDVTKEYSTLEEMEAIAAEIVEGE